jgi:dTMP kinase
MPVFITLEGPEGAGKSTLATGLRDHLASLGKDVLLTREPGAGAVGKAIREILLHGEELDAKSELFLFLADRSQHVAKIVRPHLANGGVVICDRYGDSTVVYQGYGRGLSVENLKAWNAFATGSLTPDLTFLLDLDAELGIARLQSKDRMDAQPIEFHRKIRDGFLSEARLDPARFVVLDASRTPAAVLFDAIAALP